MASMIKKKSNIFTRGAILMSKPAQVTNYEVRKWIKLTLYFEDRSIRSGSLFVETVPKFPEWFETGLGIAAFGTTARSVAALRKHWKHHYVVSGVLGVRTEDFYAQSPVLERKSSSFVTRNLLEASFMNFVGDKTQQYPPSLTMMRRWSEIKKRRPEKYSNYWLTEADLLRAEEEEQEEMEEDSDSEISLQSKRTKEFSRKVVFSDSIELLDFKPPHFQLRIVCDGLFSCRALVNDIGHHLGCFAAIQSMHLERLGPFHELRHPSLQKHDLYKHQIVENMKEISPKCEDYLYSLRTVYPSATASYRFM